MNDRQRIMWVCTALCVAPFAACQGAVDSGSSSPAGSGGESNGRPDVPAPRIEPTQGCENTRARTSVVRRLTSREYIESLEDLVGPLPEAVLSVSLPKDVFPGSFDTNVELQNTTADHLAAYSKNAELVADHVLRSPTSMQTLVKCSPEGNTRSDCLKSFISSFGRRTFRRPVPAEDQMALEQMAAAQANGKDAVRIVLLSLLQAPQFLHRVEFGLGDKNQATAKKLTGYEVATRLSFLITGRTPSDRLLDKAQDGLLDTEQGLAAAVQELLKEDAAKAGLRRFLSQWFRLNRIDGVNRNAEKYPEWSAKLGASMKEETLLYLEDFVWKRSLPFVDVVKARFSFSDANVARIYGLSSPETGSWKRVDLSTSAARAGVLTQPSILTLTGKDGGPSPILRGRYIREVILCQDLPSPPAKVPDLPEPKPGMSERQRLSEHRANPDCAGCHRLLEPVGFGLSRFNAIGKERSVDDFGQPIDTKGSLQGFDAPDFDGAVELSNKLSDEPDSKTCPVRQLESYVLGRRIEPEGEDACLTESLESVFKKTNYDLQLVIIALVQSDAFRFLDPKGSEKKQ